MIKNIIRQLLKLAQRLFTQLSNNEIVRIVKAWAIQLFTEKKEQIVKTPQRKTRQKITTFNKRPYSIARATNASTH